MTETLCTSGAIVFKAGVNGTLPTAEQYTTLINQAEGAIAAATRVDWVSTYAALSDNVKKVLEEAASNLAAIYVISYDMSPYTSRIEAEDMVNILRDRYLQNVSILRDIKTQTFINGA